MEAPDRHPQRHRPVESIESHHETRPEPAHDSARPVAETLEARLAAYIGAPHCITLGSGKQALWAAMMALGIGPGDEVITTPFASRVAAEAVILAGAAPVFVDLDRATCNIDPFLIEARVTPRTRAIMPASLYGQPADMEEINAIAQRHGLAVIEDATESFGASYRGTKSCNLSLIGCTSFLPDKPLACDGDGGALFTRDKALAQAVRAMRGAGYTQRIPDELACRPMEALQCEILLAKLEHFDADLRQRQRVATSYEALFSGRLQRIGSHRDRASALAHYTLLLDERERVRSALDALGIATTVHPLPIHLDPAFARFTGADSCPIASEMAPMVLNLPMSLAIDATSAQRVAAAVLRAAGIAVPQAATE